MTKDERKQVLLNLKALLPTISAKINDIQKETNMFEQYIEDGRNYEILDLKCY